MPKEKVFQSNEDTLRMKDSILTGIQQLCDVFSPYSYQKRKLFLLEIQPILEILDYSTVKDNVTQLLHVFLTEKDELQLLLIEQLQFITDYFMQKSHLDGIDMIIVHILPLLQTLILSQSHSISDQSIERVGSILSKMDKPHSSGAFSSLLNSLFHAGSN